MQSLGHISSVCFLTLLASLSYNAPPAPSFAHAFVPAAVRSNCRVHGVAGVAGTALSVSRTPNDPSFFTSFNDDDDDGDDHHHSDGYKYAADPRTDVKSFLTQRSLQSLHYLLTTTRDQVSADWLEMDFLGVEKGSQLAYHGTGAAYLHEQSQSQSQVDGGHDGSASFGSWQELIVSLVEQDSVTKRVSLGKKYKGGDGGRRRAANSYLENLSSASAVGEVSGEQQEVEGRPPRKTPGGINEPPPASIKRSDGSASPFGGSPAAVAATGATAGTPRTRQTPPKSATSSYLDSIGSSNSGDNDAPIDWSTMSASSTSNVGSSGSSAIVNDTSIIGGTATDKKGTFQRSLLSTQLGMKSRRKEQFHRALLSARLAIDQRSKRYDTTLSASTAVTFDTVPVSTIDVRASTVDNDIDSNSKKIGIDRERLAQDRERGLQSNPLISSDDDEFYMDLEVDPKSLATRLLAVREQIALEFVEDLILIWKADKTLLTDLLIFTDDESGESRANDSGEEVLSLPSSNAVKMHQELLAYSSSGKASSSFRKGNFDLLFNLSTQAAVHRLLKQLMSDECNIDNNCGRADRATIRSYNNACFQWLRDFYMDRVGHFFDGDVPFGQADEFLQEWLKQPPHAISGDGAISEKQTTRDTTDIFSGDDLLNRVDPTRLAEEMVRIRSDIVMEWRKMCRLVPEEDHGWIELLIIEKRAANASNGDSKGGISGSSGLDDDFTDENGLGGFQ